MKTYTLTATINAPNDKDFTGVLHELFNPQAFNLCTIDNVKLVTERNQNDTE